MVQNSSLSGVNILHHTASSDAFHNSVERYPQPKCYLGTQKKILEDLWTWSSSGDSDSGVLWLQGPADAGKSAITQLLCERLEAADCLGGSFFKRGHLSCTLAEM
jgi:polynucleotide 5'-kinase involved in rRNA processing